MAILSNVSLLARLALMSDQRLIVEPLGAGAVQPASIDVRLGELLFGWQGQQRVDLIRDQGACWQPLSLVDGAWLLEPGRLYLATTLEHIVVPNDLVGYVHGRSTLARAGVVPHQQAGLLDPGYSGRPTMEITVLMPTVLRPRCPIGQLTFEELTCAADPPYRGRYQHDLGPVPALPFGGRR